MDPELEEECKAPPLKQLIDTTERREDFLAELEVMGMPHVDHDSNLGQQDPFFLLSQQ